MNHCIIDNCIIIDHCMSILILILILKVHTESLTLTWLILVVWWLTLVFWLKSCTVPVERASQLTVWWGDVIYLEVRDVCLALLLVLFQYSDEECVHCVVSVTFRLWNLFELLSLWPSLPFTVIDHYRIPSPPCLFYDWSAVCTQHTETHLKKHNFNVSIMTLQWPGMNLSFLVLIGTATNYCFFIIN